jgi:hypothetical protein
MTLAGKFGIFRRRMRLEEMPENQALYIQGAWLAGAQACFQVLADLSASDLTAEDVRAGWAAVQQEILNAMPQAEPEPVIHIPEPGIVM